ncbi:DMT family transporter [Methylobacterium sp. SyP6R]|uniref:DMT family transporter n=1 Tax=Methylobacterium sp. SyP6R TaxID=2718876 RepID=UPI001F319097|nr:multidrug efflux SMR transporter [Methylobacterium sp. SyP6R]MCF4128524.1 multidrug efflux SMR transporter [Methylobacterium sp. SyP6R]
MAYVKHGYIDVAAPAATSRRDIMSWLYLAIAVIFEIAVGIAAGKAKGFTDLRWTIATLVSGAIATFFLSLALLTFDVGVGYAIWTSVAGVGITVLGAIFFGQKLGVMKIVGIALVIGGVVGLRLSGAA